MPDSNGQDLAMTIQAVAEKIHRLNPISHKYL